MGMVTSTLPLTLPGKANLTSRRGFLLAVSAPLLVSPAAAQYEDNKYDVPYVPTPEETVDAMLQLAKVSASDIVYDLGCGDGRIVIAAAKKYGARGVGIDIDPQRIKEAVANAKAASVEHRVKFIEKNLFEADIKEATVVTLYLLTDINRKLKPKLVADLKPGTRVVSHQFGMGDDWQPEKTVKQGYRSIHLWKIPAAVKKVAFTTGPAR